MTSSLPPYIRVSVRTGAGKEFIREEAPHRFLVAVKAPAERGLANERVLELVRGYFKGERLIIRIVSGHHSPHKLISIEEGR